MVLLFNLKHVCAVQQAVTKQTLLSPPGWQDSPTLQIRKPRPRLARGHPAYEWQVGNRTGCHAVPRANSPLWGVSVTVAVLQERGRAREKGLRRAGDRPQSGLELIASCNEWDRA